MFNSASRLINIEENVDYSQNEYKIFSLHCIQTNNTPVEIISLEGESVVFPPNSFIKGAVYHIFLKKIIKLGDAKFIGYGNSTTSQIKIKKLNY